MSILKSLLSISFSQGINSNSILNIENDNINNYSINFTTQMKTKWIIPRHPPYNLND
ncbi:hypothetical protein DDB_G0275325 [Dictyostelium discoideum AX4]|uniref:Uncharacterized protein n=1 Tax=Dictyostelium discoideum TaxID=44689 RepID=Q553R7_DICDI|nr:hypothetical protein DDB_G0275325 [Dictyostelium discoideum AX4]EAL69728.1 hypothetical protein DDB_G0275325 [Dictyostelium discoideum AX4]|eukprot:XP_643653.1 hypothetical protein DDB_G0275325 [Dictyostelium discoideum AX4]